MKLLISVFLIGIKILHVKGVILDCIFTSHDKHGYCCEVQKKDFIISKVCREITGVRGYHLSEKTNDDVKYFLSANKKVNFFPRNLTNFFKNIETVYIHNTDIKEITKSDLEPFGNNLINLWIHNSNELALIESDLFFYNRNLVEIYLSTNKIKHVQNGAFNGLEKLTRFEIHENPCTTVADTSTKSPIITIIRNIEANCKDAAFGFLEIKK